jgi:hypothetical protein
MVEGAANHLDAGIFTHGAHSLGLDSTAAREIRVQRTRLFCPLDDLLYSPGQGDNRMIDTQAVSTHNLFSEQAIAKSKADCSKEAFSSVEQRLTRQSRSNQSRWIYNPRSTMSCSSRLGIPATAGLSQLITCCRTGIIRSFSSADWSPQWPQQHTWITATPQN